MVDGREHLRSRAIVARQCKQVHGLLAALAEDFEVRVPEAVDRLELVADRKDLGVVRMRDEVDQLALEPVRVLKLVDHDDSEAELCRLANRRIVAEQVTGRELEVLEVDDRLPALRRRILDAEALEQLLQEVAVVRRELLERRAFERLPCLLVRRCPRPSAREGGEVDKPLRRRTRASLCGGARPRFGDVSRSQTDRRRGSPPRFAVPRPRRRRSDARPARARALDRPSAVSRRRR